MILPNSPQKASAGFQRSRSFALTERIALRIISSTPRNASSFSSSPCPPHVRTPPFQKTACGMPTPR